MDNVEEIKKRLDIVEFIGQYLQMKKAGINYSALCPFHKEKTPSFMVSPERQSFKCFGCGEGGDVITFLMKMEGLTFPEALKVLGERVGVNVELKPKEELERAKTKRDQIFKINLLAAKYFKAMLGAPPGAAALKYLKGRGLSREMIEKLKIGYAPASDELEKYLSKRFSLSELALAGHPERFRYRIMFPIFDVLGQVIGFSGRIFELALPKGVSAHPKYLNTPETPVFHKSRALYGINFAKAAIREQKRVVVVEGQMDVASSHEAGVSEVVASSGTALSSDHLRTIGRYSPNVIFAFDEDEAGQKVAHSVVPLALQEGLEIKLTIIKGYKDVGEMVQAGKEAWPKTLKEALPPVEWLVEKAKRSLSGKEMTAQDKKRLAAQALPIISQMPDEVEKAHYLNYLSQVVGVPRVVIERAMEKVREPKTREQSSPTVEKKDYELEALAVLLNLPELGQVFVESPLEFSNQDYQKVYNQVKKCYASFKEAPARLQKLTNTLPREIKEKLTAAVLVWDKKIAEDKETALAEIIALKTHLVGRRNETLKANFASEISAAESRGDLGKVKELLEKLQENLKK